MDIAFGPRFVTENGVRDFMNRMRLPNAMYAFMSTLLGIRNSPKLPWIPSISIVYSASRKL